MTERRSLGQLVLGPILLVILWVKLKLEQAGAILKLWRQTAHGWIEHRTGTIFGYMAWDREQGIETVFGARFNPVFAFWLPRDSVAGGLVLWRWSIYFARVPR